MKKEKKIQRLVHIHAESEIFSVDEIVIESKSVSRLTEIRDGFSCIKYKYKGTDDIILKVRTRVINPELPLVWL